MRVIGRRKEEEVEKVGSMKEKEKKMKKEGDCEIRAQIISLDCWRGFNYG